MKNLEEAKTNVKTVKSGESSARKEREDKNEVTEQGKC